MKFGCFIISSIAIAIIGWVFLSEKDVSTKTVSKITEVPEENRKLSLEVINQLNNEKKQNDTIEKANDYLFTNDIFQGEKIWVDDVDSKWQVLQNTSTFTKANKVVSPGTSDEGFANSISANKFR